MKKKINFNKLCFVVRKKFLHYSNNRILIVTVNEEKQHEHLVKRGLSDEQIIRRTVSKLGNVEKINLA